MSDRGWMRADYSPPSPSRATRAEELRFVMVKDARVMTGSLRPVDDERWEVIYRVNGGLYAAQTLASREVAEQHLTKNQSALAAIGWTEGHHE
jgi:hypothetical protein